MKQSIYDIMCPACGKSYRLPSSEFEKNMHRKTWKIRCGQCHAVWYEGLKSTSAYGAFMSHRPTGRTKHDPPVDSWNIPPRPEPTQTWPTAPSQTASQKKPLRKTDSYWALFDQSVNEEQALGLGFNLTQRMRFAQKASKTGLASPVRLPVAQTQHKRLGKRTPFSTEVLDSWPPPPVSHNPKEQIKRRPKRRLMLWLMSGLLFASLCISIALVWLSPLPPKRISLKKASPSEPREDILPTDQADRTDLNLSVSTSEPELLAWVHQSNKSYARDGRPILIVHGTVLNSSSESQSGVVVVGTITGPEGEVITSALSPCGVIHRYSLLNETPIEEVDALFKKRGEAIDCTIRPGREKKYQLVFDNLKAINKENITIKVQALSEHAKLCASGCTSS